MDILVRDAKLEDAERILDIYAYYVENTAITFEYVVPTLMDFQKRMEMTMKRYPYLVIEKDGAIQGYAYACLLYTSLLLSPRRTKPPAPPPIPTGPALLNPWAGWAHWRPCWKMPLR